MSDYLNFVKYSLTYQDYSCNDFVTDLSFHINGDSRILQASLQQVMNGFSINTLITRGDLTFNNNL